MILPDLDSIKMGYEDKSYVRKWRGILRKSVRSSLLSQRDLALRRPKFDSSDSPINTVIAIGVNAPNPHNTQAWKFRNLSDVQTLLYVDVNRLLPATDPQYRQIHIGCGCFLETLAIGARGMAFDSTIEYFPEGFYGQEGVGKKPVAKVSLSRAATPVRDEQFDYVFQRQTNRKNYRGPTVMVSDTEFASLQKSYNDDSVRLIWMNEAKEMRPFLDIFYKAMEIECRTRRVYEESRIWFRFNEKQRAEKRDGLSAPQMGAEGLTKRFQEWYLNNGNPSRWHSNRSINAYLGSVKKGIESSQGLLFLKTATNNQLDWIRSGRAYARIGLAATKLGLYLHPNSQVLQEYSEMTELQTEFNRLVGIEGEEKIQMAARVGRADRPYYAYRRNIDSFYDSAGLSKQRGELLGEETQAEEVPAV